MSIKKRKFSLRLSLFLALKSLSDTKFLHKMTRPLETALYGDIWLRGNHITYVCGFTLKTGPAVWLLGTGKNYFYYTSVGHSYIQQGLALQPLFQPHRPTTACMSVWRQKVTTLQGTAIQPQKPQKTKGNDSETGSSLIPGGQNYHR